MLLGIAGRIGAGKDTVALHLRQQYHYVLLRFSDLLKVEVKQRLRRTVTALAYLNGLHPGPAETPDDFLDWVLATAKPMGVRELLQEYGTEVRRQDDPAYWVRAWESNYAHYATQGVSVVVPDVRFHNEAKAIERAGGVVVRIERPDLGPLDLHSHASEQGLRGYIYAATFVNEGSPTDLTKQVDAWLLR